jgi:dTDP-4-amino-4,6-dideoxygalactose transaminase
MQVPLLDLKPQYQSIKEDILSSLNEVLEQQQFILGTKVAELEQEIARYCGTKHAVGVNSGSDALLLSMMATGIQPGDKVVTTPYTFFATVGSICRLGAAPLFVDIEPETYNMDPEKLDGLLNSLSAEEKRKVKAIIPVHLFGQCADMEPILRMARESNLKVIEDAAQALGASYTLNGRLKMACSMGDFGCISFFPSKNLGCFGDGGMITTDDEETARKIQSLRVHGQAGRYHHKYIGINGRLDAIQAAVLLVKLPHLDSWTEKRRQNAAYYERLFNEAGLSEYLSLPHVLKGSGHVFNQYVIRASRRDNLKEHLEKNGVGCAIYYPLSLHMQECYRFLGFGPGDFPESEKAASETLALPVFPELTKEQIEYVVEQVAGFYKGK